MNWPSIWICIVLTSASPCICYSTCFDPVSQYWCCTIIVRKCDFCSRNPEFGGWNSWVFFFLFVLLLCFGVFPKFFHQNLETGFTGFSYVLAVQNSGLIKSAEGQNVWKLCGGDICIVATKYLVTGRNISWEFLWKCSNFDIFKSQVGAKSKERRMMRRRFWMRQIDITEWFQLRWRKCLATEICLKNFFLDK